MAEKERDGWDASVTEEVAGWSDEVLRFNGLMRVREERELTQDEEAKAALIEALSENLRLVSDPAARVAILDGTVEAGLRTGAEGGWVTHEWNGVRAVNLRFYLVSPVEAKSG